MSGIFTVPDSTTIVTTDKLPIAFDYTANVAVGDTLSSPTTVLTNVLDGTTITPSDAPTVSGNLIIQIVRGSQLTAKGTYRADVTAQLNAAKVITASLYIACPY